MKMYISFNESLFNMHLLYRDEVAHVRDIVYVVLGILMIVFLSLIAVSGIFIFVKKYKLFKEV